MIGCRIARTDAAGDAVGEIRLSMMTKHVGRVVKHCIRGARTTAGFRQLLTTAANP